MNFEDRQDLLGQESAQITTHNSAVAIENLIEAANKVSQKTSRKSLAIVLLRPGARRQPLDAHSD